MAITRRRTRSGSTEGNEEKRQKKENASGFQDKENSKGSSSSSSTSSTSAGAETGYEAMRAQRMRENLERMKNLGILDLSKKLKESSRSVVSSRESKKKKVTVPKLVTSNDPPRRSSRLQNITRVSYSERQQPKEHMVIKNTEIHIEEGSNPELYTEDHEKLLGDSKTAWTLFVDGYDDEGQRIYDQFEGKSCHQCRQKTLGHRTKCSSCKSITGQFCGDCLYMRYGENVIEVNEKPDWICPVCRGICNCNRCRRKNGWAPTGAIYKQVHNLGFKSVAHYLILTHQQQIKGEESANKNMVSENDSLSSIDDESGNEEEEEVDRPRVADYSSE